MTIADFLKIGFVTPARSKVLTQKDASDQHSISVTALQPTSVTHGQKTVAAAGTAEALGSSTALLSGVRIKALAANTGNIYVGGSSVSSSDGFVLAAGEEVFIEIDDLATVYIDADTNGEGVSYIGG